MVLIDMDKPKECEPCPFCDYDGDCVLIPDGDQKDTFEEQYRDCPLKEVQGCAVLICAVTAVMLSGIMLNISVV